MPYFVQLMMYNVFIAVLWVCFVLCILSSLDAGLFYFLDAGRLARSQQPEGLVTGHLDTGFSWFPWVLEQILGWFPLFPSCHYMLPM